MNRLSIVSVLAIVSAFATGCIAQQSGPPGTDEDTRELRGSHYVSSDDVDGEQHSDQRLFMAAPAHPAGLTPDKEGPQPDPWKSQAAGSGDPGGGPQPDPWRPSSAAVPSGGAKP